jgi:DNA-binding winged helix-turn-helix (wHTH) protein/TolB-like protein
MAITGDSPLTQKSQAALPRHSYEFGPYQVDIPGQRLLREGQPVAIAPKALDLLLILLRDRGRVVSKAQLMRELWGDTVVEDANLTQQVFTLRRILGAAPHGSTYIDTVPRRGYRFSGEVQEIRQAEPNAGESVSPGTQRDGAVRAHRDSLYGVRIAGFVLLTGLAAAVAAAWWSRAPRVTSEPLTLAVLPFTTLEGRLPETGPGTGIDFASALGIGIPDAIVTRLSSVRSFRVRPTSAVSGYDVPAVDIQGAGRTLHVDYVLTGTIRTDSERVRVNVQLVRTSDGTPIWGGRYDRGRAELLAIEDAVAEEIAEALRVELTAAERERLYRRYTESGVAYERYLMGRARLRSVTEADAMSAIAEFEAARNIDPGYALAYAGIATAAAQLRVRFGSGEASAIWDERARRAAGQALELDPDLAEAHVALAAVHRFQEYDWDTVVRESQRAVDLNPSLDTPHLYLAAAYFHLGLLEAAEREVRRARELNPENRLEPFEILGAINLFSWKINEAAGYLASAHELTDSRIIRYLFGWTLHYRGDDRRADALLVSMIDEEGPLAGNARATLAAIRAAQGEAAEARALASRVASAPEVNHHAAYGLGAAHAQLGDAVQAVRWLAQAAATGFSCYPWYERDPLLDPIRADSGFADFMRTLHRSWEDARTRYDTAR